jgi:hypothetical protein
MFKERRQKFSISYASPVTSPHVKNSFCLKISKYATLNNSLWTHPSDKVIISYVFCRTTSVDRALLNEHIITLDTQVVALLRTTRNRVTTYCSGIQIAVSTNLNDYRQDVSSDPALSRQLVWRHSRTGSGTSATLSRQNCVII